MKTNVVVAVVALSMGCVLGYALSPRPRVPPPRREDRPAKPEPIADVSGEAAVRRFQARISELERLLEKPLREEKLSAETPQEDSHGPRRGWSLEEMKKSDPERYAQITNRMHRFRTERSRRNRDLMDALAQVDTSTMPSYARRTHDRLQESLQRREELESALHEEGLGAEERGEIFRSLGALNGEIRRLNERERKNLLTETAKMFGVEGEDAAEMVETIRQVVEMTDGSFRGFHGSSSRRSR